MIYVLYLKTQTIQKYASISKNYSILFGILLLDAAAQS